MNFATKRQPTPKKSNILLQSENNDELAQTINQLASKNAETLQKIQELQSGYKFQLYQVKKYQNADNNFIKDIYQRQIDKLLEQKAKLDSKLYAYKVKAQNQATVPLSSHRFKLTNQYIFLRNNWTRFQNIQQRTSQQHIQYLNKTVSTLRANINDMIKWQRQQPTLPQYSEKQNQAYEKLRQKYEALGMELEQAMSQFSKEKMKSTFLERKNDQLSQQVSKMRNQICKYQNLLNSYRSKIERIENRSKGTEESAIFDQKKEDIVDVSKKLENKKFIISHIENFQICITSHLQQQLLSSINQNAKTTKSLQAILNYLLEQDYQTKQKVASIQKINAFKSTGKQTFEKFLSQRNISQGLNRALKNHDKLLAIKNDFAKNRNKQGSRATKNSSICSQGTKKEAEKEPPVEIHKFSVPNPQNTYFFMKDEHQV